MEATVHTRSTINAVSYILELFKDNERIRELRDPFDYFRRNGVQAILNGVAFFSLHNCLERSLIGFLHPFALGETLARPFC
ncbi:MAG: hypothetical protein J07HQX50_01591 [Haloquadratum sp. J07HQX50]|nr:MAG: hypothetical protein J07HQX50_01591 [Haloquadratum sp. J07HQX50]